MSKLDKEIREQLLFETYIDFEQQHNTSSEPNVLVRLRDKLELAGAIQLGFFVACLTIFLNFVVVNLILHLS
jgi:hypothetical protein